MVNDENKILACNGIEWGKINYNTFTASGEYEC